MRKQILILVCFLLVGGPAILVVVPAQKESKVTRAKGTFDVKLSPLTKDNETPAIDRMSIDKKFHGDIQGTSRGEMLSILTATEGSAGYVAIERVSGTIDGRTGTFDLQHHGIMNRGAPQLSITVVPDSGSGELKGISGRMNIDIADGKHSYDFEYAFQVP